VHKRLAFKKAFLYLLCLMLSFVVIFPFLWGVLTSLKTYSEIYSFPITYFPRTVTLEHYLNLIKTNNLMKYFFNSILVSSGTALFTLLVALFSAYSLSRISSPYGSKSYLLTLTIICMNLPQITFVVPFLRMLREFGLVNTYQGLIMTYLVLTVPVSIWFLMSFFEKIPRELEEAGMIDGCSRLQVFLRIVLPLMRPGISAIAIYAFFLSWNEYMFALSYLSSGTLTLPVFLGKFVGQYQTRWGELFAGSTVSSLVPIVIFAWLQKQFIFGLARGALKE